MEGFPSRISVRPRAEGIKRSSHLKDSCVRGREWANRGEGIRVSSPKHEVSRRGKGGGRDNVEGKVVNMSTFGTGGGREYAIDRQVCRVPAVGR